MNLLVWWHRLERAQGNEDQCVCMGNNGTRVERYIKRELLQKGPLDGWQWGVMLSDSPIHIPCFRSHVAPSINGQQNAMTRENPENPDAIRSAKSELRSATTS